MPDFEVGSWNGVLGPAKPPAPIVAKRAREVERIVTLPDVRERLSTQAAEPIGSTPEEFRAYIRNEVDRWGKVAKAANITLD